MIDHARKKFQDSFSEEQYFNFRALWSRIHGSFFWKKCPRRNVALLLAVDNYSLVVRCRIKTSNGTLKVSLVKIMIVMDEN